MRYARFCFFMILLTTSLATTAAAQTQTETAVMPLKRIDSGQLATFKNDIDVVKAKIGSYEGAERIMSALIGEPPTDPKTGKPSRNFNPRTDRPVAINRERFKDKNFYCIIHVLSWSAPSANDSTQTVVAQNWYLYNQGAKNWQQGTADTIPRLYGAKDVTLLVLHLNKEESNEYTPSYEIKVEKKTPAYIAHLLALAGLFTNSGPTGPESEGLTKHYSGVYHLVVQHRPSDITITPEVSKMSASGAPVEVTKLGDAQKFDNEGLYQIDFSVGVPVRKISQLSFESTNGLVTAKEVDKTDIMAFFNFHPRPVDIKATGYNMVPHFVGGVAIASKPLDKIFVGAGFGPVVANFYLGALFVKQQQLSNLNPGDVATPGQLGSDLRRRYKAQVGFGLNLPVGAIVEKLKKK
jgi:hypothetical protein